jgi:hypothetical protein
MNKNTPEDDDDEDTYYKNTGEEKTAALWDMKFCSWKNVLITQAICTL